MSLGTISYYLAKGVLKYNSQLKQQLKNEPELAKQIDELVEESKRVVDEIIENTNKTTTGSGGFFKYNKILSRNMVAQEKNMSFAAACIKQLAKDDGIEISESAIRTITKTTYDGTYADGITIALKKYFKEEKLDIRLMYDPKITDIEMIRNISKDKNSWIAWISPMPDSNTKRNYY
ncbi:hypothetical protein FIA58_007650 [Flavobacterium jejuense]|uniref:Peptidase C39 domain-containing protein n=1 Tax=Flavobacterium jejuense TaxID=1544455 RepID=A0ABX0IPR7_9FLAO|nr:cysteine peptidase family C39 domain-containing protein [Flavobacterium jejuense]NHN25548.1 hypothetical protein [Flavobacterium jejuense]